VEEPENGRSGVDSGVRNGWGRKRQAQRAVFLGGEAGPWLEGSYQQTAGTGCSANGSGSRDPTKR